MRLNVFGLLSLLVALAIVAVLLMSTLGPNKAGGATGGAASANPSLNSLGGAISKAEQSAAQQDAAATQASQTAAP